MARKKRRTSKRRKSASDALKKVRVVKTKLDNVWALQDNLRNRGYFARAVARNKVVTTAPPSAQPSAK